MTFNIWAVSGLSGCSRGGLSVRYAWCHLLAELAALGWQVLCSTVH